MQSIPPAVTRRLMRELSELKRNSPEGIRVTTSDENMLDVTGIIEGPEGTPYAGGYFRVKFKFTEEFPVAPPQCWFSTKIFHPNVSTTGEICVNTLKKDWKSSYGIEHILITIKCLLIYPNAESALDEEAGKLLLENYDSYCERAKLITAVHATPRSRPVEFDTPTSSSQAVFTSSKPLALMPPQRSVALLTQPVIAPTVIRKLASIIPPTQPLQSSPSNTLPTSHPPPSLSEKKGKERHASPPPLGTTNANVSGGVGVQSAITTAPRKAVKRVASGGATEKRKRALKRL